MEKSPEIASGHSSTYFRELDTRLGRWWAVDPVTFPHQSPYCIFDNNPVVFADASGAAVGKPVDPEKAKTYKAKGGLVWNSDINNWSMEAAVSESKRTIKGLIAIFKQDGFSSSGREKLVAEKLKYDENTSNLSTGSKSYVENRDSKKWQDVELRNAEKAAAERGLAISRNLFGLIYVLSPAKDIVDAGKAGIEGHYGEATAIITLGVLVPGEFDDQLYKGLRNRNTITLPKESGGIWKAGGSRSLGGGIAKTNTKLLNQFNSVESLLESAAPTFNKLPLKHGEIQGFIKGDANAIFKAITNGGEIMPSGAVKMSDGTFIKLYQSSSRGINDIHINMPSQTYKIRVN